jgi:uncharacterized membrane protein YuzA (DUF378 family)
MDERQVVREQAVDRYAPSGLLKLVVALAILGALNWGLVGFFDWDLVRAIFRTDTATHAPRAVSLLYGIIGVAGVAALILFPWASGRGRRVAPERPVVGRPAEV